jgi:DNA-directed RNA polymerase specialized sigma subunit
MVDLIRRHVPLSRGAVERRRMMREKHTQLSGQLGREPYDTELAAALGVTLAELEGCAVVRAAALRGAGRGLFGQQHGLCR